MSFDPLLALDMWGTLHSEVDAASQPPLSVGLQTNPV